MLQHWIGLGGDDETRAARHARQHLARFGQKRIDRLGMVVAPDMAVDRGAIFGR
ncbi:hypothetical protein D9M69_653790 [compost metagenome]